MGVLTDLEGVSQIETECIFLEKPSDIIWILRKGLAATTAGSKGAINIWKDDEGYFRCEACRHLVIVESKKYKYISMAEKWVKKWRKIIK